MLTVCERIQAKEVFRTPYTPPQNTMQWERNSCNPADKYKYKYKIQIQIQIQIQIHLTPHLRTQCNGNVTDGRQLTP